MSTPDPAAQSLQDGSLSRRFLGLTAINVVSNVTVPLVGLVDTAMLGHLDQLRFLAGVALASVLFDYLYWTSAVIRMGTTGPAAQAWGRGDRKALSLILYRGLLLALLLATAFVLLQWPIQELGFGILSGEEGVKAAGREYFGARIWGAPAVLCNYALVGWFLGREESGRVLVLTVISNVSNVVLNVVFIVHLDMAAFGAGLGSALAAYLALAIGLALVWRSEREPWRWSEVLERDGLRAFFALNADITVRTVCLISTFAAFTNLSAALGTAVLAANAILLKVLHLASNLIDGVAFATESLGGILFAQGDRERLTRLLWLAMACGEAAAFLFLVPVLIAPEPIFGLFTTHAEVVALCQAHSAWLAPVLVFGAMAYVYDGFFIGLAAGRVLRNAMLVSTAGFVPLAAWGHAQGDTHLLWAALATFMLARAVTLAGCARSTLRRLGGSQSAGVVASARGDAG